MSIDSDVDSLLKKISSLSTLSGSVEEGNVVFQQFSAGQEVTKAHIENLLREKGIEGQIIKLRYGYYRKIMAWLQQDNGDIRIAKICLHPYSVELLRQEAKGYAEFSSLEGNKFCVPDFRMIYDSSSCGIALMDELNGRALKLWNFPEQTLTQLAGITGHTGLGRYLNDRLALIESGEVLERLSRLVERMEQFFGDRSLPLSPSHGDFIYWNLLCTSNGDINLFDFEYYASERVACFDDWHWFVLPLGRKAIQLKCKALITHLAGRLPAMLYRRVFQNCYKNTEWLGDDPIETLRLLLAVYLLEQSVLMYREHQMPEIIALIGTDAYSNRQRLLSLYEKMIEKVAV